MSARMMVDGIPVELITLARKKIFLPLIKAPYMAFQAASMFAGLADAAAPTKMVLYFDRGMKDLPADT